MGSAAHGFEVGIPEHAYVVRSADDLAPGELRAFYEYWLKLKGDRMMPARTDISPRDMKPFLRHVHLHEVVDGGRDFRGRVVASQLCVALGEDLTGRMVSDHPRPDIAARLTQIMRYVVKTKMPLRTSVLRREPEEVDDRRIEALWLPLGAGETVDQIVALAMMTRIHQA